jgi:hypothetical protein
MNTLRIQNIGPIKDAELELNKINVFIGPQSSGKSTIAKIISFCTWLEKDVAISQSLENHQTKDSFRKWLENFHKLKDYFKEDSYVFYQSEVIKLEYSPRNFTINWVDKYAYKRSKISYIPAERNMVIIPEMEKTEFSNNNIRSFLFDWFDARKKYSHENRIKILDLEVNYYFNESTRESHIEGGDHIEGIKKNEKYDILLSNSSSGLQSVVPLIVMIEYLTNWIYSNEGEISFEENEKKGKASFILSKELVYEAYSGRKDMNQEEEALLTEEISALLDKKDEKIIPFVLNWNEKRNNLFNTANTQFIIEEPEQNLFPETQKHLIYYLLEKCLDSKREHRLTLTTHSPYILYTLNNCMMGYLVKDKMPGKEQVELLSKNSWIDPKLVSIWQIKDGEIDKIQGEDGLIGKNYFDDIMKEVMDDFYAMLTYYGNEE